MSFDESKGSGSSCGCVHPASCNGPFRNNEDVDPEAPASCRTVSFDVSQETHYVIVVHGTFAPPAGGPRTPWYQPAAPGEINFCNKLGALLAEGPLGDGCVWRVLPAEPPPQLGIPYPFYWDGTNRHEGRIDAAHKLAGLLDVIGRGDPSARIHVIAHSHGGNVLLKAIELYMKGQGRKDVSDLPPAVLQQFWAAYKSRYDLIRHWQKPDLSNTCWRFVPFLVVKRSMGEHRAGGTRERYPWARYRWLDSLLRLPSRRQRLFLSHRLATSPLSNAVGAVVFLGTPFYVKTWQRHGVLLLLVTTAVSVGVTFVVMWGYVLLWRLVVLAMAGELSSTTMPSYLPFSLAAALLLFAVVSVALELWRSTAFYSGNIYHAPGFDWSHAMSALVIHAGKLDEVSLALSTEPIARAYIVPQLASMLKTPFWKPLPRCPTTNKCSDWTLYISNTARILLWNIIFILPATAVALLSRLLAPLVISVVRKAIVTVSFGLSPKELSFASVFVDEGLHLDEWSPSHHVEHWNVQKLLALAKTRSLRGELMAGYEDDTCDMGKAVFGEGLLEEGVSQEGVTGKGVAAEGLIGEGKAEERMEQEEVGEREVRVTRQGEGDERVGAEGAGSAGIDAIQTSVSRPQQGSCMQAAGRTGLSGTHLGLGEAFGAAQQQMVAAAGEKGGQGRAPGSVRRSLSLTEQALRQGGERGEGGEEMGEEGGESKEGRAGGGGSAAEGVGRAGEGVGRAARRGGVGEASVEGAREEMKGKQQQQQQKRVTEEKGVRPRHEGQLKTTGVQHGSGRQQRVSARGSREEAARVAYEFLWNDGALEAAASESETYKLLRPQLQAITHNPRLSDQECVRQVKQLCVMIEER
ncbi:unnamed protein product [Closterium sp. Naga37s-1]|nr:unnamed protein product [Closterium sp. Naga37s-1]